MTIDRLRTDNSRRSLLTVAKRGKDVATTKRYIAPTKAVMDWLLEGGYDLDVLGRCVAAHLNELVYW